MTGLAGVLSGVIGAMGMGGGGVLIIYLSLFTDTAQSQAQGINLLFFLPVALVSVIRNSHKNLIEWKIAVPLALLGIFGTVLGSFLCGRFDNTILAKMFGVTEVTEPSFQYESKQGEEETKKGYTPRELAEIMAKQ